MDDATDDQTPTLPAALAGVVSARLAAGGSLADRYQVRARLGRGASKEVYLAYDTRLDREVAFAIVVGAGGDVTGTARARVTREAQVTGRLGDHPNIITVYDSGELDGLPYLVLRAMRGGSLADLLQGERPGFAEAVRLASEIASALAHAHAHGVVHRDVKPDNVWLAADGTAALGDFGVAHQVGLERLTAEGIVVGTVRYLSPEQIRGEEIGPAGDLYALGVTLYELVTGRPPFTARDPSYVLTQHLTVAPEAPSQHEPALPPALERLILRLLAKQPGRRPASAAGVYEELVGLLSSLGAGGPARSPAAVRPATASRAAVDRPSRSTSRQRLPDARRVVAVLAVGADVVDPEALHGVLDRCAGVIEHHGGSVEPLLGDALVGIFGLTESQGDDAVRAARAAVALLVDASELRLGIETGEVFSRDGARGPTISGAPIGSAVRLAERAGRGEILLGDAIRATIGQAARIDAASGRLLDMPAELPALLRPSGTPFVGRGRELDELLGAFSAVRDSSECRMVTVAGPPGIGKSRLAGEFLAALGDSATVLAGRCLAYGEGTTYRALAEMLRGLGGDTRSRIEELLEGDEQAIRGILGAVGLSDEPAQAEETSWALRRLLGRLARDRPVVVAVEDIHWAERALLDLLDHVVALSSGSPILLVCLTRPELLESRPSWAAARSSRSVLLLDALDDDDARQLAERLGASGPAARIAARAEGNPLFVEQLVAVDAGQDTAELPTSIQAVLAARIDRLDPGERELLLRASVEGRTFHTGPLAETADDPDPRAIVATLAALADKGLIGTDHPEFAGEAAYRFTHALIRDAAYAGVPKLTRAQLHAGVADWLAPRPAADEIVGYHLEQACLLAAEIGRAGERERALATRAVERFERAARGALARADPGAASTLLERAVTLVADDDDARSALLPALGASLHDGGRMSEAAGVLDEAITLTPDPRVQARARVEREFVRLESESTCRTEESLRVADLALPVLERQADDHGQSRVWLLRAQLEWLAGQVQRADDAWLRAAECARSAGNERDLFDAMGWRATAAAIGPAHVDEAIRRCEEFRALAGASPVFEMWMLNPLAQLHAMKGDMELAERLLHEANETRLKLGNLSSMPSHHEASIRLLAGQPELAEAALRTSVEMLGPVGDSRLLATTNAMLAQAVYAQGRTEEAGRLCEQTADAAADDDIITRVLWRSVLAKVLAHGGRCDEAVALAREAVALIQPTDLLSHHGDAMLDLAEALSLCARADEAAEAARTAVSLFDLKGNASAAARAHALLGTTTDD